MDNRLLYSDSDITETIEKYKTMVYGIALTYAKNKPDADDVFQEVFLIYFQKNKTFNDEEHRKAWIINTAVNCGRKAAGNLWRMRTSPIESLQEQQFEFSSQAENLVYNALRELPRIYRAVLYLFYFEELTIMQICKCLKIKSGTVRMRLTRGRKMMYEKLKGDYFYE